MAVAATGAALSMLVMMPVLLVVMVMMMLVLLVVMVMMMFVLLVVMVMMMLMLLVVMVMMMLVLMLFLVTSVLFLCQNLHLQRVLSLYYFENLLSLDGIPRSRNHGCLRI